MNVLLKILKIIGVIILLLIVVSFFLPARVHVERSVNIKATPEVIFAQLNNLKNWPKWSPWYKRDPNMINTYEGPEAGVGAKNTWKSDNPQVGEGSMVISESKPYEKVVTDLNFGDMGSSLATFKIDPMGDSTKVTWALDSEGNGIPWYIKPMSKYFNLFMDKMLGPDFEAGLADLKAYTQSLPKEEMLVPPGHE